MKAICYRLKDKMEDDVEFAEILSLLPEKITKQEENMLWELLQGI